ncbi:MAG TPA: hypothetical protein EYP32_00435 [Aquificaceae bacterium]|nr:hypothetical protein [Aquificaceae bacterium]
MKFLKLEKNKNVVLLWFEDDNGRIKNIEFRSKKQIKNFLILISASAQDIEIIKRELEKIVNSS